MRKLPYKELWKVFSIIANIVLYVGSFILLLKSLWFNDYIKAIFYLIVFLHEIDEFRDE